MAEPSYFVIAGPTAVGKSEIALSVAEQMNGEIVGADAFQLYAGLPLLSASPSPEARTRVPHHLVQSVPLGQSFDAAQWLTLARASIESIRARGRRAIVCGGTGLYLRALLRGLDDLPPGDPALRAELEKLDPEILRQRLLTIEPDTSVDLQNPRRVIRSLEIHALTGQTPRERRWRAETTPQRGVFLWREREELLDRITWRTRALFAAGVWAEVEATPASEIGPTAAKMLGLDLLRACAAGQITRAEAEERLIVSTRQYAKRQMTWFRQESALHPLCLTGNQDAFPHIVALMEQVKT